MTTLEGVNPQMIANNLRSYQPTHPGEVLKDELDHKLQQHLCRRPSAVLSHMVVEWESYVFENLNLKEAEKENLEKSHSSVNQNN